MTTAAIARPESHEYGDYYQGYIDQITETDIIDTLEQQVASVRKVLGSCTDQQASILHEPYTWTLKQAVGHCIDVERVFGYRALRFASNDSTPLPGFDQDAFVAVSRYNEIAMPDLLGELEQLRNSNVSMLKRLDESMLTSIGTASDTPMSVRAIAFILAGHVRHHLKIAEQRLAVK